MGRRCLPFLGSVALGASLFAPATPAGATGSLSTGGVDPVEQRVAIAVSANQTTLWTSLAFDGEAGTLAVVLPVPAGTALDTSSRAFFEALFVATSPRVVPPDGASSSCPGASEGTGVAVSDDLDGVAPIAPVETLQFDDASNLQAWAASTGLTLSQTELDSLAALPASTHFVTMRYAAPGGPALTQTLRAVLPGAFPELPFVLTEAKSNGLRVTTFEIGPGRSHVGGTEVEIDLDHLAFDAKNATSNYDKLRTAALLPPSSLVVELSSHESLRDNLAVGSKGDSVDGFVKTYFDRAKLYGDTSLDEIACEFQSAVVLGQEPVVSKACPRADLGVVAGSNTCFENPQAGEVDPSQLRCGGISDDLSLMLSGLVPEATWLTRTTIELPAGGLGDSRPVSFPSGLRVDPVYTAESVDLSNCDGQSGSSSSSSTTGSGNPSSGAGGPGSNPHLVPVRSYSGCTCDGAYETVGFVEVDADDAPDSYYDNGGGCSSDTSGSDSYSSTPDSCENDSATGDDCSGDSSVSSDGCDCSSDSGSSGCSGDSASGDDCSSSEGGDSCGSAFDSCDSGGGSSDCNCRLGVKRGRDGKLHRQMPRLSGMVYALALLAIPVRRWSRRKKTKRTKGHARTR